MKFDKHHKLSQSKVNKVRYGDLIHDDRNIQIIDHDNHMSGKMKKLNEREFCEKLEILECEYCTNWLGAGCVYYYGFEADECLHFRFDKEKYKK